MQHQIITIAKPNYGFKVKVKNKVAVAQNIINVLVSSTAKKQGYILKLNYKL